jgi:hypothetical protein
MPKKKPAEAGFLSAKSNRQLSCGGIGWSQIT